MTALDFTDVVLAPVLPMGLVAVLGGMGLLVVLAVLTIWRRPGAWLRALGLGALVCALLEPRLLRERRLPQKDITVVVVDDSPSQTIGNRHHQTETALAQLLEKLGRQPGMDVRVERLSAKGTIAPPDTQGATGEDTHLFAALHRAVADLSPRRLAGAILMTDGQIHDAPRDMKDLPRPLHALLTGHPHEGDRRLVIEQAPGYGLVGHPVTVQVRVEDSSPSSPPEARLTLRHGDEPPEVLAIPVGCSHPVPIAITHGGPHVLTFEVEAGPAELSLANNRAVLTISGVRDRLKVLLVSGRPHSGERTWRNILKADAGVDLVHFTILRPVEKDDYTPLAELALIPFPMRELFEAKLKDFDLIIFDTYGRYNLVPFDYLDNIKRFVTGGGAILVAVGPEFSEGTSLAETPLKEILPVRPNGHLIAQGFKPVLTDTGRRHPVTGTLLESAGTRIPGDASPPWGRWLRQVGAEVQRGDVLMRGAEGWPLLVLDRAGAGRVAVLLSDTVWLWARGYEGGGPHAELLRRLIHWLMKEPALEEDALTAELHGTILTVTRRSLHAQSDPLVTLTRPDGTETTLSLTAQASGHAGTTLTVTEAGLYRLTDGRHTVVTAAGNLDAPEWSALAATDRFLAGPVRASGGGLFWLAEQGLPEVRRIKPGHTAAGTAWLGVKANGDTVVTGLEDTPLLPVLLAVGLGALVGAWYREGRA
ncbi:MAG: hypothetical protein FD149_1106 [Rhodospirillaceae bacterium]|nr:MAG: hypothetical protein FD149_1106 [Rhodospirillaceae bacterium]